MYGSTWLMIVWLWVRWFVDFRSRSQVKIIGQSLHEWPKIDEYDVTMVVPGVRVTSQTNCGDVTLKTPALVLMAKWVIDDCFVCSGH